MDKTLDEMKLKDEKEAETELKLKEEKELSDNPMFFSRSFISKIETLSEMTDKYKRQLENEPIIDVDDIQGDIILGFNKSHQIVTVLNITNESQLPKIREWLKNVIYKTVSTTRDVINNRKDYREKKLSVFNDALFNFSVSYRGLQILVHGTTLESDLSLFSVNSAFVAGANGRSAYLGDPLNGKGSLNSWDFGKDENPHILINICGDSKFIVEKKYKEIVEPQLLTGALTLVNKQYGFRGKKGSPLYGHEHFGFKDGLSQPEIRGKYDTLEKNDANEKKYAFLVRRVIDPNDSRFPDYAQPGFRLLDPGNFLLGYEKLDTTVGTADNTKTFPDWCKGGSYLVYRKLHQDVHAFWDNALTNAKNIIKLHSINVNEYVLAMLIASKIVGRYWDGTPLTYPKPFSGSLFPPNGKPLLGSSNKDSESDSYLDWKENGFEFDNVSKKWPILSKSGIVYIPTEDYKADPQGKYCPYAGHIRKINPRDQSTDIGPQDQTLQHRLIRRAINYGTTMENIWKNDDSDRGLLFLCYQYSIENQFEFLQRHWANSATRPTEGGDDFVIGQPTTKKDDHFVRNMTMELQLNDTSKQCTISTMAQFVWSRGAGYFLTIPKSAISTLTDNVIDSTAIFYDAPAKIKDFKYTVTPLVWDWTLEYTYWTSLWSGYDLTAPASSTTQVVIPTFSRAGNPSGVAYRLPDWKEIGAIYTKNIESGKGRICEDKTYLQFRSTKEIYALSTNKDNKDHKIIPRVNKVIAWQGFPKRIKTYYGNDPSNLEQYEYVEELGWPPKDVTRNYGGYTKMARQMDEYLEWYSYRDPNTNKLLRVDLSCESPEYWTFLFNNEPDTCLALYQQYVSPLVTASDLVDDYGNYNTYNKWNTTDGIMHLNCPPNSLFAEIYLAAEASARWENCKGQILTDSQDLINCASYGLSTRASDPTIGSGVNSLIRSNYIVAIENPVGLYLQDLNTAGWMNNKGQPFTKDEIAKIVNYQRGLKSDDFQTPSQWLRVSISIPEEMGFTLGDCSIGDIPIQYAGQIVDASCTMYLRGVAIDGSTLLKPDVDKVAVPCKSRWNPFKKPIVGPTPVFRSYVAQPNPPLKYDYSSN